jgi:hypothetical protein
MPFRLEKINLIVELEATIDLLASHPKRLSGGKLKCVEEVFEKCFESIASSVWE